MKKLCVVLWMIVLTLPVFANANPSVTLQSTSLGYPFNHTFTVNVTFSEPVTGFSPASVNITNGTVVSITGSSCQPNYVMVISPTGPGKITIIIPANVVTSVSTSTSNLASNLLIIQGLDPTVRPATNFNLRQWSLNLPIPLNAPGNSITIGPVTLSGVPNADNGYTNSPYFFTDPLTGSMNFFSPLNGGTTPNSGSARCELLETLSGALTTWSLNTFSSNTLSASLLVNRVTPDKKRIVIGQIHDKGNTDSYKHSVSNSPLVKLYYDMNTLDPNNNPCNGCVYAQVRITPAQSNFLKVVSLIRNVPLNTLFKYQITL